MNGIVMDYRFSLFGVFDILRNNVSAIIKDNPFFISHRIDGNEIINGLSTPVFLLEANDSFLRIGNNRIDFIFKSKSIKDNADISTMFFSIKNLLPYSFDRIAINYSYNFVDETGTLLKHFIKKTNLSFEISETRNFSLTQAFSSIVLKRPFNNIVSIQTGQMMHKTTFETKRVISCLFDVNSVPAIEVVGSSAIKKEEIMDIFGEARRITKDDFEKIENFFRL